MNQNNSGAPTDKPETTNGSEPKRDALRSTSVGERRAFSLSQLASRALPTPEQIRHLKAQGRFAEMTPHQAGYGDEK